MEHTQHSKNFEKAYNELTYCLEGIQNNLSEFEQQKAEKLLNFCKIMCRHFYHDDRFSEIFRDIEFKQYETSAISIQDSLNKLLPNFKKN